MKRVVGGASAPGPIALLVNVLSGGGAQRRIASLANDLVALGRTADVVSPLADGPMRTLLAPEVGLAVLADDGPAALGSYIERGRPSVVMSCVTDTHRVALAARDMSEQRVPTVLRASRHPYRFHSPHDLARRAGEPLKRRRAGRLYARADAAVALSRDAAEAIARLVEPRELRIETISNPVLDAIDTEQVRRRRDALAQRNPGEPPLVLGIGRLERQKDFATLLRAFALVRRTRSCRLVLLGEGRERGKLATLARRLEVARDVEMPGEVADIPRWLARAELVVSSSLWEGMQAVPIEAMAAGCPVVATDCPGGAREALQDGRLGPLVPVGAPQALADAIIEQLDSPTDPVLLAQGAEPYTRAGKAERYLDLFDELAAQAFARI